VWFAGDFGLMLFRDSLLDIDSGGGSMGSLEIRKDRTPVGLRKLAKGTGEARVARRLLAIANALDGMSREDAARSAGMDRQTLRDWVLRYNAHGVDGLADRWNGGRPPTFTADEQAQIVEIVLAGPDIEASGLSAYTLEDLSDICQQRFGKRMHPWSLGRLLKKLGLSRQKTRPIHPETDPVAAAAFKKRPAHPEINL
jgi:transposase